MTLPLDALAKQIVPEQTILLFGAGASIPSGAPSVSDLMRHLSEKLEIQADGYSFAEYCSLFEMRRNRKALVAAVRETFKNLRPTGGILNLPHYDWSAIFTTNYEDIVEKAYLKAGREAQVLSSNFDYSDPVIPGATQIYKIHGTIGYDTSDGHRSRLILTTEDNEVAEQHREALYDRLKNDLNGSALVIIGNSLSDNDLKDVVRRAIKMRTQVAQHNSIYLLLYSRDENRALLYESQGLRVSFGSIDDFFLELAKAKPTTGKTLTADEDPLSPYVILNPVTTNIKHEAAKPSKSFAQMYAGAPAPYPEIRAGLTFERTQRLLVHDRLIANYQFLTILGASGVGKTTLARQICLGLVDHGFDGWEHNSDRELLADTWRKVAADLEQQGRDGVLLLDDAHLYLPEINKLADYLTADRSTRLRLVLTSPKNHWNPRVKSANLSRSDVASVVALSTLDSAEISRLLNLVSDRQEVSRLVDKSFKGFTIQERRRRLIERCSRDFFVCLKNIFANDSFDVIVLREYASVSQDVQGIYRYICALESLGVVVHRQLVIRLLNVVAQDVPVVLRLLEGLVEEFDIDEKISVYGWRGRHQVISEIIAKHKFSDPSQVFDLIKRVVRNLSPTYKVEMRTLRQLCSLDSGIGRLSGLDQQNELLRMMISVAPGERVPRHRLIANLIRQGSFNDAETEIRVFEEDLGIDGPVRRHKVRLLMERAISSSGIMAEDRLRMLDDALLAANKLVDKFSTSPHNLRLLGDVSLEVFKLSGNYTVLDDALDKMTEAEKESSDPDITQCIRRFQSRMAAPLEHAARERVEEFVEDVILDLDG